MRRAVVIILLLLAVTALGQWSETWEMRGKWSFGTQVPTAPESPIRLSVMSLSPADSAGGYVSASIYAVASEVPWSGYWQWSIDGEAWSDEVRANFIEQEAILSVITDSLTSLTAGSVLSVRMRASRPGDDQYTAWRTDQVTWARAGEAPTVPIVTVAAAIDTLGTGETVRLLGSVVPDLDAVLTTRYSLNGELQGVAVATDTTIAASDSLLVTYETLDAPVTGNIYALHAYGSNVSGDGTTVAAADTVVRAEDGGGGEPGAPVFWVAQAGTRAVISGDTATLGIDEYTGTNLIEITGGTFAHSTIDYASQAASQSSVSSVFVVDEGGLPLSGNERIGLLSWGALADSLALVAVVDSAKVVFRCGATAGTWSDADTLYVAAIGSGTPLDEWDNSADNNASYTYADVAATTAWSAALSTIDWFGEVGGATFGLFTGGSNIASWGEVDVTESVEASRSAFVGLALGGAFSDAADRPYISHHANSTAGNRPVLLIWARR